MSKEQGCLDKLWKPIIRPSRYIYNINELGYHSHYDFY